MQCWFVLIYVLNLQYKIVTTINSVTTMKTFATTTLRNKLSDALDWMCDHGLIYSFAYNVIEAAWQKTYFIS